MTPESVPLRVAVAKPAAREGPVELDVSPAPREVTPARALRSVGAPGDVAPGGIDRGTIDWDSVLPPWAGGRRWRVLRALKRALDIALSLAALCVLPPLLLLIAAVIWLDSPGPVLHRMEWIGLRGRRFYGYKFRTMVVDAEERKQELLRFNEMSGPVFKMTNDPRVTRVGRILRRWSLDELPQIWSVLRGDLSMVGPRAPGPHEYAAFTPEQRLKMAVIPGITCTWQVSGRSSIRNFDDWVRMDVEYIRNWSFGRDIRILLATIPAVLSGRGAT